MSVRYSAGPAGTRLLDAAAIGRVPGIAVLTLVALAHALLLALAVWPLGRSAKGELAPRSRADSAWDG